MNLDELSGTTKVQRDKWWKAFWQYLDENQDAGKIVRRWQRAGCDPRKLGVVFGCQRTLLCSLPTQCGATQAVEVEEDHTDFLAPRLGRSKNQPYR